MIRQILKLALIGLIFGVVIYLYIVKIPVWCLACEGKGTWTRCMDGTGEGSLTCKAYTGIQDEINQIKNAYNDANAQVQQILGIFDAPRRAIQEAINKLTSIFNDINIPTIPSFNIPTIPGIGKGLDFSNIKPIDPCDAINRMVSPMVGTINQSAKGIQDMVNTVINGLNTTIAPINDAISGFKKMIDNYVDGSNDVIRQVNSKLNLGIKEINKPSIPSPNIKTIDPINIGSVSYSNLKCDIDVAGLLQRTIGDTFNDLGNAIVNGINDKIIKPLQTAMEAIKNGLNVAINAVNNGLKTACDAIKSAITTVISFLQTELENLNIFSKLFVKMQTLVGKIQVLNIPVLLKSYIMPFLQNLIPGVAISLGDTMLLVAVLVSLPIIMPVYLILFILIDLIPF